MKRVLPLLALLGACAVPPEANRSHEAPFLAPDTVSAVRASEPEVPAPPVDDGLALSVALPDEELPIEPATGTLAETDATVEFGGPGSAEPPGIVPAPAPESPESAWAYYRARYDGDGDKSITREEYTRDQRTFLNLDVNQDGVISSADFAKRWEGRRRTGQKDGAFFLRGGPMHGDVAPVFRLPATTGEEIALESFIGKKPVVLVFGSFT